MHSGLIKIPRTIEEINQEIIRLQKRYSELEALIREAKKEQEDLDKKISIYQQVKELLRGE